MYPAFDLNGVASQEETLLSGGRSFERGNEASKAVVESGAMASSTELTLARRGYRLE
jgi:hypothetical protein